MVISDKLQRKANHRRRGSSATELALILPLFMTIALGCVDFGRFAYSYIAVTNASRAGGSWAMLNQPSNMTTPPTSWQTSIASAVSNEMSQQPGFQSSNLTVGTVTPVLNPDGTTYRFTVTATYPFQTIVNWNLGGFGLPHSFNLTQQVTMRFIR
jgi:Flp pilus assembly protein TadG